MGDVVVKGVEIKKEFLTPNRYSRPQKPLKAVKAVVLHWVANPRTTAEQNRAFFENRKEGLTGFGSAHFIIDKSGIIQCIPLEEMAYHVGAYEYTQFARKHLSDYPNDCTIGIEMCHVDWDGHFDVETLEYAKKLVCELLKKYNLKPHAIIRHYDVTLKRCPKLFVDKPDKFTLFKWDVASLLKEV